MTSQTSLLRLILPVQGEFSGTWGDQVNAGLTNLLDSAIAGTTTLSTDADVTLTTANYSADTAREAILLCTGSRTAQRTITAPASSKIYTIINATTGGFATKLVGSGPTTGLVIPAGSTAVVAWNGSDFAMVAQNLGLAGVVGSVRNLKASAAAAATTVTYTADEIVVGNTLGGTASKLASYSQTLNLATTGAGGMDTGTLGTNGTLAVYAISNPATGATSILGVDASAAAVNNIYGGANMPAGYTHSALIGIIPSNSVAGQLRVFTQQDRQVFTPGYNIGAITAGTPALITASVVAIPYNAKLVSGYIIISYVATTGISAVGIYSDSASLGRNDFTGNLSATNTSSGCAFGPVAVTTAKSVYVSSTANFSYSAFVSSFTF